MPPEKKRGCDEKDIEVCSAKRSKTDIKKWKIRDEIPSNDTLFDLFEKTLTGSQSVLHEKGIRAGFRLAKMETVCQGLLDKCSQEELSSTFSNFFNALKSKSTQNVDDPLLNGETEVSLFLGEFTKFMWWGTTNVDKLNTEVLLRLLLSICRVPEVIEFMADFPRTLPKNVQALMSREVGISYDDAQIKWKEMNSREKRPYYEKLLAELKAYDESCDQFVRMHPELNDTQKEFLEKKKQKISKVNEKLKSTIAKLDEREREDAAAEASHFTKFRQAMLRELPTDMNNSQREKFIREAYAGTNSLVLKAMRRAFDR